MGMMPLLAALGLVCALCCGLLPGAAWRRLGSALKAVEPVNGHTQAGRAPRARGLLKGGNLSAGDSQSKSDRGPAPEKGSGFLRRGSASSAGSEGLHEISELLRTFSSLSSSGLPFGQALQRAGSATGGGEHQPKAAALCAVLSRAAEAEHLGLDPIPVLQAAAAEEQDALLARFAVEISACWHAARRSGIPLGDLLEVLAEAAEESAEAEEAVAAALAAPAATARLLLWLPLIGAGLGWVLLGSDWVEALFSPAGMLVSAMGAVLTLVGTLWSRRIAGAAAKVEVI